LRNVSYAAALNEALHEEMARDERVFILGEDVGPYASIFRTTRGLLEEFGRDRVRDTPISEAAIVGAAVGAALMGMRPVAEIMYSDFMTIATDQLVNHAAKLRYMHGSAVTVPMVVRTQGGVGRSNAAQHSQSLETWFAHVPGLKVVVPSTPYDAKGLLKSAIRDDNPVVCVEHKALYAVRGEIPEDEYLVPIGKADVKREGRDATVVATSLMVPRALEAAGVLEAEGIEVEVVDPRTLAPLDEETILASVRKTGRAVVVYEACRRYGLGAEIASVIMEQAFDHLDAPVVRLGGLDVPVPYTFRLEQAVVPSAADIVDKVRNLVRRNTVKTGGC